MTPVFADTFYFLALLNPRDAAHKAAVHFSQPLQWPLVTTGWVITEVADALAPIGRRAKFLEAYELLRNNKRVTIVSPSQTLLDAGIAPHRSQRPNRRRPSNGRKARMRSRDDATRYLEAGR